MVRPFLCLTIQIVLSHCASDVFLLVISTIFPSLPHPILNHAVPLPSSQSVQLNAPEYWDSLGERWAWSILEEEMYHLIRLCVDMGYHPAKWRTSIPVALQTLNHKLQSYRLIWLLEVLGKSLEMNPSTHRQMGPLLCSELPSFHLPRWQERSSRKRDKEQLRNDAQAKCHHKCPENVHHPAHHLRR